MVAGPVRSWVRVEGGSSVTGWGGALYTSGMRPICFLSDFGLADDFVGTCKGVMLSIAPGLSIVDLTHEVPGFGVRRGRRSCSTPPATCRRTRYIWRWWTLGRHEAAGGRAPGGEWGPAGRAGQRAARAGGGGAGWHLGGVSLTEERFHLHPVSNTFHGRDVFAPVAAHLAAGVGLSELGEAVDPSSLARLGPGRRP